MACEHPPEDRLRVWWPEYRRWRDDRTLCGLCGEVVWRIAASTAGQPAIPSGAAEG